jgi:HEAT repeat protein
VRYVIFAVLVLVVGCAGPAVPTAKYFSGEPVPHWLEQAKSADAKARKQAVEVLGNVGPADPAAIPTLTAALRDPDAAVRDAAVLALSKNGPAAAGAVTALEEATRDRDANVRAHALVAVDRVRGAK